MTIRVLATPSSLRYVVGRKDSTQSSFGDHFKISFQSKALCVRYKAVTFLKSITLLLVVAIANPMCCCLAFGETDMETTASSTTDAHACCHLDDQENPERSEHSQDSGDCYHEDSNLLKINDTGPDVLSNIADPLGQSCDYLAIFNNHESSLSRLHQSSDYHSFDTLSPGSRTSRTYCVFLL